MTRGTIGRQLSLKRLSTWPFDVSIQFQHSISAFDFSSISISFNLIIINSHYDLQNPNPVAQYALQG
jgi:hypothetical protein